MAGDNVTIRIMAGMTIYHSINCNYDYTTIRRLEDDNITIQETAERR